MKREIIAGLSVLAVGGAIMGGFIVSRNQDNSFGIKEKKEDTVVDDKQKIEKLWVDELKDNDKYGFCLAEASINTNYTDPALGATGIVEYTSKEVLLYNKEAQKFYIMSRQADFKYKGRIKMSLGGIAMDEPVNESGKIDETYERNEMPLRLDYANKYVFSNPDTKETAWVSSSIGDDTDKVMPHHGCAGKYPLDNTSGKDLLVDNEHILIDRDCKEKDINGVYDGDFNSKCNAINYSQAMEIISLSKARQALQKTKDTSPMDDASGIIKEKNDASAGTQDTSQNEDVEKELLEAIESSNEVVPNSEDIKKQLKQFKEMQADQSTK